MAKEFLGEFEEIILTLVAGLHEDAYGAAIAEEIETRLKREVNLSAVHVTLYRLEDKGLIKSKFGGGTSERGGRRKRVFLLTASGKKALEEANEMRNQLFSQIPKVALRFSAA